MACAPTARKTAASCAMWDLRIECTLAVIASEAKQSSFLVAVKEAGLLRRYAPRNDGSSESFGQYPALDRIDLQRDVATVDAGLRERAGGEPQSGLTGAPPHVAQLLRRIVKAPDPPDARGDLA